MHTVTNSWLQRRGHVAPLGKHALELAICSFQLCLYIAGVAYRLPYKAAEAGLPGMLFSAGYRKDLQAKCRQLIKCFSAAEHSGKTSLNIFSYTLTCYMTMLRTGDPVELPQRAGKLLVSKHTQGAARQDIKLQVTYHQPFSWLLSVSQQLTDSALHITTPAQLVMSHTHGLS